MFLTMVRKSISRICFLGVCDLDFLAFISDVRVDRRPKQIAGKIWTGAVRQECIMSAYYVALENCGSAAHLADLQILQARNLAIPHDYGSWPLHCTTGTWTWCRVLDAAGNLATGFAVHLTPSRAIPGTCIGRVERVGRNLHEETATAMGGLLRTVARKIPRLLRLDVRVFDENPLRRRQLCDSLRTAGWSSTERRRAYSHTLVLELAQSESEVLKGFTTRVRSTIKKALGSPALRFGPISGTAYADRIRYLYTLPFARTGGVPPSIDVKGILDDSQSGDTSFLIGAFGRDGTAPADLVALIWARLHGDHVMLEINASERSELFSHLSPGFGLVSQLIGWSIQRGAQWIDLGGLPSMETSPDDPMRGVVEFKRRFSSDFREVAEEWRFEPSPLLASAASAIRSIATSVRSVRHPHGPG
jgi:FemAB family